MSWLDRWRGVHWDPPGQVDALFILLAVAVVAYAIVLYRRNDAPLTVGARITLTSLRALALLTLVVILARPVISLAVPGGAARGVLVLLDGSWSMTLPGEDPTRTRAQERDAARASVTATLGNEYPVAARDFAGSLGDLLDSDQSAAQDGEVTNLADALEAGVAEGGPYGRPGAMVLISDGTQTAGPDPLPAVRRLGVPVHTVGVGSTLPAPDLAMTRVRVNREAFAGERAPLEVALRLQGLPAAEVRVTLVDVTTADTLQLATETVSLGSQGAEQRVSLAFTPTEPGLRFLEARVSGIPGEEVSLNNRRLVAVSVREEKTRLLLLSGRLTWDHTFVRRALEADSTLDVATAIWKEGRFVSGSGAASPGLSADGLRDVRVILLDHVTPEQLGPDGVSTLITFVRGGGGLGMITGGGSGVLSPWRNTPLATLLPVQIADGGALGETQVRLTAEARRHVLFDPAIPGSPPLDAWNDLPPLMPATDLGPLRGGAEGFLSADTGENLVSLVSWTRADRGRVLLVAAGGIWRWDFSGVAHRPSGNILPAWWRRTAQWLSRPEVETRLDIHPEEFVMGLGRPAVFVARVTDDAYQPIPGAQVEVQVTDQQGATQSVELHGEEGFLNGVLAGLAPGRYTFTGTARSDSAALGTVEGMFAVDSLGAEMERLEADHELLARIAAASGGAYWSADSLHALANAFAVLDQAEEERVQLAIWDHPLMFLAFVLFASLEWLLRRRRGLI